jgi:hypothetical protein
MPKLRWQTFEIAIIERYRWRESSVEGRGGTEALIEMAARNGGAGLPRRERAARREADKLAPRRPVRGEMRYPDIKTVVPYGPTPPTRKEKTATLSVVLQSSLVRSSAV